MDTEPKGQEKSNGNNGTPSDWLSNENDWQKDWPAPSWGKPKAETSPTKSEWGNNIDKNRTDTRKDKTTSPSNLEHRFTTCQICETPLVTKIHQNGPLTCLRCRTWISADNFEANETAGEVGDTTMADTTETQLSEENDTNGTQATSAPQTPPRNFRQAATYIMSTIMWREATDGHVQHQQLNNPITHHPNYYAQLKEIVDSKSTKMKLRPELLQFGKLHLKPEIYEKGYLLSQNATTLKEKNERLEIKTKSTQTPETVETTTRQSISFLSDSQTGLTAPAVLGSISAKNPPPAPPGAGANFCRFYSIEK